jgi:hypothetical protein
VQVTNGADDVARRERERDADDVQNEKGKEAIQI